MHIIYLVIWVAHIQASVPDERFSNPYTGQTHIYIALPEDKPMRKEFQTLEEAQDFIDHAPGDIKPTMQLLATTDE